MDHEFARRIASTTRTLLQTQRLARRLRVQAAQQRARITASRLRIQDSVTAIRRADDALSALAAIGDKNSAENPT